MLRFAGRHEATVGQNNIGFNQVVNCQAMLARQISVAAAERKTGDTGCGNDSSRNSESKGRTGVVDIALHAAGPHPYGAGFRIYMDTFHC